jgi:hypothetical protein
MSKIIDLVPHSGTSRTARPLLISSQVEHTRSGFPSAMALATAMTAKGKGDTEPVLEIEQLVAVILQTCRRHGRRPRRLRPLIDNELERHCAKGDATAMALRAWIDRSTPFDQQIAAFGMQGEG